MEPVTKNLPVIAMRGLNVFPRMNTSFDLERPISVHALERAMENGEEIFLVTQREIGVEQPEEKDLYLHSMTKYLFESIAHKLSGPYPPVSLSGLEHTKPRTTPI